MHEHKQQPCQVDDNWFLIVDDGEVSSDGCEGINEYGCHHLDERVLKDYEESLRVHLELAFRSGLHSRNYYNDSP